MPYEKAKRFLSPSKQYDSILRLMLKILQSFVIVHFVLFRVLWNPHFLDSVLIMMPLKDLPKFSSSNNYLTCCSCWNNSNALHFYCDLFNYKTFRWKRCVCMCVFFQLRKIYSLFWLAAGSGVRNRIGVDGIMQHM